MAKANGKVNIVLDSGEHAEAQAPVVVSASRSTDIPAFYADWFFERLRRGYSAWTNPFNGVRSYVAYCNTRFIVFWSKNPRPLLEHLDYLDERGIGCYVQYTLNDYEREGLERGVPALPQRIDTFHKLVERLGAGRRHSAYAGAVRGEEAEQSRRGPAHAVLLHREQGHRPV